MSTWISAPLESNDSPDLVICTLRQNVEKYITNPKFHYRLTVSWSYTAQIKGMPSETESEMMEKVQEAIEAAFKKDPVAVLTGVYTGAGTRDMIFYTLSLNIFQRKLNEILAPFPQLPLSFEAEDDPDWEEYHEMLAIIRNSESEDEL